MQEKHRQKRFLNLVASENFTSEAVLEALGSVMQGTLDTLCWAALCCRVTIYQVKIMFDR